jgi:hypothetical protein
LHAYSTLVPFSICLPLAAGGEHKWTKQQRNGAFAIAFVLYTWRHESHHSFARSRRVEIDTNVRAIEGPDHELLTRSRGATTFPKGLQAHDQAQISLLIEKASTYTPTIVHVQEAFIRH